MNESTQNESTRNESSAEESFYLADEFLVLGPTEELKATYARRCERDKSLGESSERLARAYELACVALRRAFGGAEAGGGRTGEC